MFNTDRILILAPHTDDGELGCGGAMAKYSREGKEVIYVAFSSCAQSLPENLPPDTLVKECKSATAILGIKETNLLLLDYEVRRFQDNRQEILDDLLRIKKQYQPQTVFIPAQGDVHQDHQAIYQEGIRAFKDVNLIGYELPWNNLQFQPNYFERLSEDDMKKKIEALSTYASQTHRTYMQKEFIHSLAVVRGVQCQYSLAEAFEIYHLGN